MRRNVVSFAMYVMSFFASVLLWQSCGHKELCYDHSHISDIRVEFDWSGNPDAVPRTMVAHFFRSDGSYYNRFEFTDRTGGTVRVEAGEYIVLFHNGETDVVREQGSCLADYMLRCEPRSLLEPMGRMDVAPRPPLASDEPVCGVPEDIWAGMSDIITVAKGGANAVRLVPSHATRTYTVIMENVANMSDAFEISAAVTGMSASYSLSSLSHAGPRCTLPLEVYKADANTLIAEFRAFGHCPEGVADHIFTVYTSEMTYQHFDITGKLHDAPDENHVVIRLEGLVLPAPGTGMSPSISGWDDVEDYEIPMD